MANTESGTFGFCHTASAGERQVWPHPRRPFCYAMKSHPLPSTFPHTKRCLRKGIYCEEWSWETGRRSREYGRTGEKQTRGCVPAACMAGLDPIQSDPVWSTPQDCLPEKWKGECFFTSSVPGWSRVPRRLKSVPRTSVSRQGSPPERSATGTPGLSGCHSTAWEGEPGMEGFQNTPPLTVSCGPCLSVGIYVCWAYCVPSPVPGTSYASVCSYPATPDWAGAGGVLILRLWKLRSWVVAWLASGVWHCRDRASLARSPQLLLLPSQGAAPQGNPPHRPWQPSTGCAGPSSGPGSYSGNPARNPARDRMASYNFSVSPKLPSTK